MDIQRNQTIFQDIEKKYNQQLKTYDPDSRLFVKGVYQTNSQVCVVRFDSEDINLAIGCADGTAHIFQTAKSERNTTDFLLTGQLSSDQKRFPTTALRWRSGDYSTKNKFILITSNTDGTVTHWNTRNGQALSAFKEEGENEIYAIDLNQQETYLATAGRDSKIRVYDEETLQLLNIMAPVKWTFPGHSNRVFSVKFDPVDTNILLSGGWDQNVIIWDLRTKLSQGAILGPKISGDALDIQDGKVLTGSHKMSQQLQIWDIGTRKILEDVKWDPYIEATGAFVFGCQFSKSKHGLIMGGASGSNEARIFDCMTGQYLYEASINGFSEGIFTVDFANLSNRFAISGSNGLTLICSITQPRSLE